MVILATSHSGKITFDRKTKIRKSAEYSCSFLDKRRLSISIWVDQT